MTKGNKKNRNYHNLQTTQLCREALNMYVITSISEPSKVTDYSVNVQKVLSSYILANN